MNYHQLKQYLFNNLWHGENGTPNKDRYTAIASLLVQPPTGKVWGIDISHWNLPPVNLKRMKDLYGLSFVIIKGCDGTIQSKYFADHVEASRLAGIPYLIYDWLYPGSKVSIDAQTTAWANQYKAYPDCKGIRIDAEWTTYAGASANPSANDLRAAHDSLYKKINKKSGTYTAKGYADQYLKGFVYKADEPLWVAHYGVTAPSLPIGATTYQMWQFTSTLDGKALDPNGNAELDGDYYNGTPAQFVAEFGTVSKPETTGGTMYLQATGSQLMREAGNSSAPAAKLAGAAQYVLGPLSGSGSYLGDIIETDAAVGGYYKIKRLWRNSSWSQLPPAAYCTTSYFKSVTFTPPDDPIVATPPVSGVWTTDEKNSLLFDVAEIKADIGNIAGALLNMTQAHTNMLTILADLQASIDELLTASPTIPPTASDGYTGPKMGIYEVIDVPSDPLNQQWGGAGAAVPLFDDNGGDRLQIKEQLYDLWMNTLEGFKELVDSGTIVTDEKGLRFILGKAVKGQKLLIAAQGKSDGVMKGMIVGFSNEDNPLVGAVNFASCTPETTPWLFNKVKNVRRWIPIMSGNKGNNWWIPMSWLKKVS